MSYILDALKKSDQQRQQQKGPTLQTVQQSQILQPSAVGVNWLVAIIVVLLCSLLALAGWYYLAVLANQPPAVAAVATENRTSPGSTQPALGKPSQAVAAPQTELTETAPVIALNTPVATPAATPAATPVAVKPAAARRQPVVEKWQLPDNVQQQLPALTFSFHVYSDNPERRTIIINNRRVKQGDSVTADLLLEEITPKGVVLQWQEVHRFTINVVEDW